MKAAVWHGYKDIRIEEKEYPKLKTGNVIVKVEYAGICGTDRHEYTGPNFIPTIKPHRLTGKVAPLILGHEFSGEIVEVAEDVYNFKIGDKVTANGSYTCKVCAPCKTGRFNICKKLGFLGVSDDGAFAEYVTIEANRLFKIPKEVSTMHAAVAEPLACGIHATNLVGDVKDKVIVIIGPGIIGLSAFFAAKFKGAKKILVYGLGDDRKELIESYGGHYINTANIDLHSFIEDYTQNELCDIVYECVGLQSTLDDAINITKPGGKIMVMGVFEKPPVVDLNTLQEAERTILTSQAHTNEIETALEFMKENKINVDELITKVISLENIVEDGFEKLLKEPSKHIKILVKV